MAKKKIQTEEIVIKLRQVEFCRARGGSIRCHTPDWCKRSDVLSLA